MGSPVVGQDTEITLILSHDYFVYLYTAEAQAIVQLIKIVLKAIFFSGYFSTLTSI